MNQAVSASIATLGSFGTGTVFGWSAVATKRVSRDFSNDKTEVTSEMISWVTSLAILGAFLGGPLAGFTMNNLGRKSAILIFSLPFLLGWTIMCSAYLFRPDGFFLLYIGRILTGICAGSYLVIIPTYIKECSSDSMRGILGAAVPLMLVTGILYTFIIGAFCDWIVTTSCCCIPPIFLALGTLFIPETPKYLMMKKKLEKAVASFKWLNRITSDDIAQEQFLQLFVVENTKSSTGLPKSGRLMSRPVLVPVVLIVMVMFFQQFGGVNAVTLYTNDIFESAGDFIKPEYAIILIGFVQVIFVLAAMFLIDILGRKMLLMGGSFVMGLSLVALGIYFYVKEKDEEKATTIAWLPVLSICVYMAAYSCGVGSVPWVLGAEIYNPDYRAESATAMTSAYWIFGFIVAKIYDYLKLGLHEYGSFWLYGGFCMGGSIFAALFVPETKGKSSEEILKLFGAVQVPSSSSMPQNGDGDGEKTDADLQVYVCKKTPAVETEVEIVAKTNSEKETES